MRPRRIPLRALLGLAVLLCAGAVRAQSTSASMSGSVRTEDGQPVVDAVVQARAEANGVVRTVATDENGRYRLEMLMPGTWVVAARLADGQVSRSRTIDLGLQESVQLDFTVGLELAERMTVTAEAPLVDRTRTTGELRLAGEKAEALPISGRVITDLALLDSSVAAAPPGNFYGERGSVFTVNGQSGRSNTFLVDGLDNNDQTSGTSLNAFFSQQVIEEFVMMTHQYSPEFGRASGGVLNIVTRRGSNELDWDVFFQGSTTHWNSAGSLVSSLPNTETDRSSVDRFQGGFRLGGPMRRDKAFYFLAFEHQEADEVIPYTGLRRDGGFGGKTVAPTEDDSLFVRMDFVLNPSNFLMIRLSGNERSSEGLNVGGVRNPESGFRLDERDAQIAASLTTVVTPSLFNELRLLAGHSSFDQFANSDRPGVTRPSGVFGGNELNRQIRDEDRLQLVENVTWMKGNHTLKVGMDVTWSKTKIRTRFNPNGSFLYRTDAAFEPGDCGDLLFNQVVEQDPQGNSRLTTQPIPCPGTVGVDDDGDGVIDEDGLIQTYPVVFSLIDGAPSESFEDTRVAVFAQDRWRVGPRLLLDYGLRYDVNTYTLAEESAVDSVFPNGGASRDEDNIAPRFGFSFSPKRDGKLVIRGGAGIFYDKLVLGFPAVAAITSQTQIGFLFPQGLTLEITEDVVEQVGIDVIRQGLIFPRELTLFFSTGTELDTPYTVQYTIGAERAIGRQAAFRFNFIRALGYHAPLFKDLNPVVGMEFPCAEPSNIDCVGPPQHRDSAMGIPAAQRTGSIAAIVTEGRSWYTGVDLSWRWQSDKGWYSLAYTWSRGSDLGFDPLKDGVSLPPDSDDIRGEKGRSDGDRRHRMVFSGELPLPWMGLRASTVVQLATGTPFNVVTGRDENLDGFVNDRLDGIGRNTGEQTPLDAVNALRVANGLTPVSDLEEPYMAQVDLRVSKPFSFQKKRGRGEVFVQVFNVFNRFNGGRVDGRILSANFGRAVGLAGPPRTFELGVRFGY